MRKIIFMLAASALAATGFVGASLGANGADQGCLPGTSCTPTGGTTTRGTTAPPTTTSTTPQTAVRNPTLKLSANAIDFGSLLTVSGNVSVRAAGQIVQIYSQWCGFNKPVPVAQRKTRADGSYSFVVQPLLNGTFFVRHANRSSKKQALTVRPKIELRRASGASFDVTVSAGNGAVFSNNVVLERSDGRHWRPVASGKLHSNSDPAAITAVFSASIRAAVPSGAKLRASASQATVGRCYRAAKSPVITG